MVTSNFSTKVISQFFWCPKNNFQNPFSRPETDIEAQNELNSEARAKPPDYFEDLPPTYEEAMKMKNLEETSSKVIIELHNYAKLCQNRFFKDLTARSQIAAVPSVDPVTNIVPCGENRTSLTP